jgi:hypothetical protein
MGKKSILSNILFVVALFGIVNCENPKPAPREYPMVNTYPVTNIGDSGATLNGEILTLGASGITDYGFVYGRTPDPTLDNSNIISLGKQSYVGTISTLATRDLDKEQSYYVRAYAIGKAGDIVVYGQEIAFTSLGGVAPTLTDFEPQQGAIGDTIVFVGSGFSDVNADNQVYFGLVSINPFKSRPDSLWCIVPTNTVVGQNAVSVSVGQSLGHISTPFTLNAILISSFSPSQVSFGDTLTITGSNFPRQTGVITVNTFGQNDTIVSSNPTQLKIRISSLVNTPSSTIKVTAGTQTVSTTAKVSLIKPVITGFTPIQGPEYTQVQIMGNYFSPIKLNNVVTMTNVVTQDVVTLFVDQSAKTNLSIDIPTATPPGDYTFTISVATQATTFSTTFKVLP